MNFDEIIDYFGSVAKTAKALNVTNMCIYRWSRIGYIPLKAQRAIERVTKGKFVAERKRNIPIKEVLEIYGNSCDKIIADLEISPVTLAKYINYGSVPMIHHAKISKRKEISERKKEKLKLESFNKRSKNQ